MTADLNYVYNNNTTLCTNIWLWQIVFIQTWLRILPTDIRSITNNHEDDTDADNNDDESIILTVVRVSHLLHTNLRILMKGNEREREGAREIV